MANQIDYYLKGRVFEWLMTCSMLGLSVQVIIWPKTIEFSAFTYLVEAVSDKFVALFMFSIGWIRACALALNGHEVWGMKLGPLIRSVVAALCAVMWGQFAFALLQLSIYQSRPSPGLPFWTMFVFGEMYVAYRAVRDGFEVKNGRTD